MPPRSAAAPTPQIAPRGSATLSVARLPQILDLLSRASPHGASLAALSAQTGIPKSSLLNILRGLQSLGYLTSVNNVYHLGSEAYALANLIISTLRSGRLPAIARPALQRLADEVNETVILGAMSQDERQVVYVDAIESRHAVRVSGIIGNHSPLYASTGGWVMLAYLPDAFVDSYLRSVERVRHTSKTLTGIDELKAMYRKVREDGVSIAVGQMDESILGFGAPVFDAGGAIAGVVIISSVVSRALDRSDELAAAVRAAGREISGLLGYQAAAV
ncbi:MULTISPECIES: IclR family transcriptional regulator [unclassified Sphingomonas]|uniref:IclR family transcriptional regulator n=1 Tax=unclassified Sphingomonas TaxID=196159 RepID=UPI0006F872BF|nr:MULTISPECIES: IclR family transcriptional regulator [unclassified Sphingomonas]KQX17450.1 hypothetical protein ASD17_17000 [Sphingomonas sp. Root1294]KQY70376.1 hypothetical protein ASD39_20895 [Sphingomonas sp. Root50]KRB92136.1 hypothetical protein ASE22_09415 [Sphingomonas sp. Root720]